MFTKLKSVVKSEAVNKNKLISLNGWVYNIVFLFNLVKNKLHLLLSRNLMID